MIRSKKTDDIHKAVKYGVWTSSPQNNLKIRDAFQQKSAHGGNVFFFFTYLNAPGFVGLARLTEVDLKREFPYWGEIGRWVGVMRLEWVYLRDLEFHNLQKLFEQSPADGSKRTMADMTDGSRLSDYNAREMVRMLNERPEPSLVLKKFVGHDHQEKALRASVDEIIRTNAMDEYKKKGQKKEDPRVDAPVRPPPPPEVVVTKKVSQAELKRQRRAQARGEEGAAQQ